MTGQRWTKCGRGTNPYRRCGGGIRNQEASSSISLTFDLHVVKVVSNQELASFRRTVPLRSGSGAVHTPGLIPQVHNESDAAARWHQPPAACVCVYCERK